MSAEKFTLDELFRSKTVEKITTSYDYICITFDDKSTLEIEATGYEGSHLKIKAKSVFEQLIDGRDL